MDTPSVGQRSLGEANEEGVQFIREMQLCHISAASEKFLLSWHNSSIGPYLQELVVSPSRAKHCASLHVSREFTQKTMRMSISWPPLFVWNDGKAEL